MSETCAKARDTCFMFSETTSGVCFRHWKKLSDAWHFNGIKIHRLAGVAIFAPDVAKHCSSYMFLKREEGIE